MGIKQEEKQKLICPKCNKSKTLTVEFFKSDSPLHNGYVSTCKDCIYEIYNDYLIRGKGIRDAVINICELMDRPFYEDLFDSTFKKEKDSKRLLGIYLKNIAMRQFQKKGLLRFKDSVYENHNVNQINNLNSEPKIQEGKIYNKKWMGEYTESDMEYLENYIEGLHRDFKIVTENHRDYAKKIAKASLHMDKCFEEMMLGVSSAEKKYKDARETFDTLSKSAQFSESQRGINDVSLGCFGIIFDKVEKSMYVPEHQPENKDMYDNLLDQFSNINKSL